MKVHTWMRNTRVALLRVLEKRAAALTVGLQEDVELMVSVDLRDLVAAARSMQFALGSGQILVTRTPREEAMWTVRHDLERLVWTALTPIGGVVDGSTLTWWLRAQAQQVLENATSRLVRARLDAPLRRLQRCFVCIDGDVKVWIAATSMAEAMGELLVTCHLGDAEDEVPDYVIREMSRAEMQAVKAQPEEPGDPLNLAELFDQYLLAFRSAPTGPAVLAHSED